MDTRILILAGYAFPEQASSSYLGKDRNQAFADAGFKMELFTPTPCRGISKEVRRQYCKPEFRHEKRMNGAMTMHRFSMFAEGNNPLLRALRYTLCGIVLVWKGIFNESAKKCNVIFVPSTPPIQGAIAAIIKKFTGKRFVYNLQDIFPDSLVGAGLAKKGGILWKIGRAIENFTYKHADRIIVIGEDFKRNIRAKGVPEEKIAVIYNWVNADAVSPVAKEDNPLFEELCISRDKFHVVYAGNLGNAQNIDIIINAANKLAGEKNIDFLIFGTGGLKEQYIRRVNDYSIDNVKFFPLQPAERVSQVYGLGDVCIVACKPGLGGAAMPSKTWSIMSSGRAVLANFDEGELKTIVENNGCGMFTKAGDLDGFVSAIRDLSKNPELCDEMGRNGREFILKNLTQEVGTSKYVEVIKAVTLK